MNDPWPTGHDDQSLDQEKALRLAVFDLSGAVDELTAIEYDRRKGDGSQFTADDRAAASSRLDTAYQAWLAARGT